MALLPPEPLKLPFLLEKPVAPGDIGIVQLMGPEVWAVNDDGTQFPVAGPAGVTPTLTAVLTAGNSSGGQDITMSGGSNILFDTNIDITSTSGTSVWVGRSSSFNTSSSTRVGDLAEAGVSGSAFGASAKANGASAFAAGDTSTASGQDSIAAGHLSVASNIASIALGFTANAPGLNAMAIGGISNAIGQSSIAFGWGSGAVGMQANAIGFAASAGGINAGSFGTLAAAAGDGGFAVGYQSAASGTNSSAMGRGATASATSSGAFGHLATSAFTRSTAIGPGATTTAVNQIMMGTNTDDVVTPGSLTTGLQFTVPKGAVLPGSAPDGSLWYDTGAGTFSLRKAGAWHTITVV